MHAEIHSISQCLFSVFCVPGVVLSTRDGAIHETGTAPAFDEEADRRGRQTCQQIVFKGCGEKRDWTGRIALLGMELGCIKARMGPHQRTANKCSCCFHNSKNNMASDSWKRSMRRLKVCSRLVCKTPQMFSGLLFQLCWGNPPWGALLILISTAVNAPCEGEQVALLLYGPMPLYFLLDGLKH